MCYIFISVITTLDVMLITLILDWEILRNIDCNNIQCKLLCSIFAGKREGRVFTKNNDDHIKKYFVERLL